jgi:hypothetical protein
MKGDAPSFKSQFRYTRNDTRNGSRNNLPLKPEQQAARLIARGYECEDRPYRSFDDELAAHLIKLFGEHVQKEITSGKD